MHNFHIYCIYKKIKNVKNNAITNFWTVYGGFICKSKSEKSVKYWIGFKIMLKHVNHCKEFNLFTLFNLALLFKLYFSFRESYLVLIKTSNLYHLTIVQRVVRFQYIW